MSDISLPPRASTSRIQHDQRDPIPHGLPLRFSQLAVPVQGGASGNEALVSTLSSSLADVVSLGPVRRILGTALNRRKDKKERFVVAGAEGVVEQVSRFGVDQTTSCWAGRCQVGSFRAV